MAERNVRFSQIDSSDVVLAAIHRGPYSSVSGTRKDKRNRTEKNWKFVLLQEKEDAILLIFIAINREKHNPSYDNRNIGDKGASMFA